MAGNRPNFLVIMCDQFRADCIGALGSMPVLTPALDALAGRARVFRRAYTPAPVCVPARAALHYSRYPATTGCVANHTDFPAEDMPGFVAVLSDTGYRTHGIGKCHFLPDPLALRGFQNREIQEEVVRSRIDDDYLGYLADKGHGHVIDPHGVRGATYYLPQQAQVPPEDHPSQWIGDRTIAFLQNRGRRDPPFFLFSSFIHPHPPFPVPAPWYRLYDAVDVPPPEHVEVGDDLTTVVNRLQMQRKFRDLGTDPHLMRAIRAAYFACTSLVDYQIGRILAELARLDLDRDTVVIFLSDHGEYLGDYGCFGKRGMHDVVARVPLVVADPSAPAETIAHPVSLIDVGPSILERAGIEADLRCDGRVIFGGGEVACRPVYSQFGPREAGLFMVADDDGKYIYSTFDRREFLFVAAAPEDRNLVGEAGSAAQVERYRRMLNDYDPELAIVPGPLDEPRPEEDFARLNPDLGPVTSLHPWVDLAFPEGYA
jgi:arylsulfatase